MKQSPSYVYFAFFGEMLDIDVLTARLGITPTDAWIKGDPGRYNLQMKYSCWELKSTQNELLDINALVNEVVNQLSKKTDEINQLKEDFDLTTVLQIVMYIDTNEENSTPILGHELEVIDFLHKTQTTTDLDIYRYDSTDITDS